MLKSAADLPQGFGTALYQNMPAMQYFNALPEQEQMRLAERAKKMGSKEEMDVFVNGLLSEYNPMNRE